MTGRILTYDHGAYDLPVLLEWKLIYTGSVPCDEFSVTCLYSAEMAEVLHRAVSFLAMDGTTLLLRGMVDEYVIRQSEAGRTVTITGRGLAARLLDNESRAMTYQAATLEEILRNHVTPYGISCARTACVRASSVYTVPSGTSQWKALEKFCQTYGGFTPGFLRDGSLVAAAESGGKRFSVDDNTNLLSLTKRENHYGVLSEVLVVDKTRNVSYVVKNQDFLSRGGQCRRVLYTPGQSTWGAMRYTGEYQIAQSREDEVVLTACLPGTVAISPGDRVALNVNACGLTGEYRVSEAEHSSSQAGETTTITMKEIG